MHELWHALNVSVAIFGTGVVSFVLARLPRTEIRAPLYFFVASGVLWAIGDLVADGATTMLAKQVGVAVLYTGSILMPPLWWGIVLRWAATAGVSLPLRSASWRRAPLWWAGAMWLAMITNPWHGAFMTPVIGGRNVYEPLWFMAAIPSYALIVAALAVEVAVARRAARRTVRRQAAFLIAASSVTLAGNWLYVANLTPVNPMVLVLYLSVVALIVGMARDGLFGVMPAALREVTRSHPDGLVVVESDGYVAYANRRAHALLAPVALRSDRPLLETLEDPALQPETPLPSASVSPEAWWRALTGPTGLVLRVGTGSPRWLQVVSSTVEAARTSDGGRLLQLTDVTGRRHAEAQARQRQRLESVTSLARSVSRDFRNAFTIVRANAGLLEAELADDASQRRVSRILEAARAGAALADDLEAYTGETESVRVPVDLADILAVVCRRVEPRLPPNLRLHHRRPARPLPIEAHPVQIGECVYNLLINAVEAAPEGERQIEVRAGIDHIDPARIADLVCGAEQPAGDYVFVEIRDESGGMDPEVAERAFEPFFSTREKGRGNGLSAVIGIARAHDAAIGLYNDPGWGCTFVVYLPLDPRPTAEHRARAGARGE